MYDHYLLGPHTWQSSLLPLQPVCYEVNVDVFIRDINGVLRCANGTEYGLAAGVFTRDINKALHVTDQLLAGTVFVNTYNKTDVAAPFGGYKQSGFGKDLGSLLRLFDFVAVRKNWQ